MSLSTCFDEFLSEIRPTPADKERASRRHTELRERLLADELLSPMIVTTFLQGSYRRATILRPTVEDKMDVDLVVVTTIDERLPPSYAFKLFEPFVERHYRGQWKPQGRSIGIKLNDVDLDLVITAKPAEEKTLLAMAAQDQAFATRNRLVPSVERFQGLRTEDDTVDDWYRAVLGSVPRANFAEARQRLVKATRDSADEWRKHPLRIPDRDARMWQDTHPLAQIEWTKAKNAATNGHFINIVKAIKWWHRDAEGLPKYPKGYPLEHMAGQCCPDDVTSFADGLRATLEAIATTYRRDADAGRVPFLPDHGCPEINVLARVEGDDFQRFHRGIDAARVTACRASDCRDEVQAARVWKELLGDAFPLEQGDDEGSAGTSAAGLVLGGFSPRNEPSSVSEGRFA
ncbi:MAG: nucleotidyltransferase [Candidatus Zixiibacteriota bacterium]